MKFSKIATKIMFDYESLGDERIIRLTNELPLKIQRSIAFAHPDNRIRFILLKESGVEIGDETVVNQGVTISDNYRHLLIIGQRVSIGPNVNFICSSSPNNSGLLADQLFSRSYVREKKIIIGDDAWIGANVTILPGVEIGIGAIIGASSIVTKSVSSFQVAAGNPARDLGQVRKIL